MTQPLPQTPPPPERERIDPARADEVAAWARRLGFTADEVLDAVRAVGDVAKDVEQYLRGGGKRTA